MSVPPQLSSVNELHPSFDCLKNLLQLDKIPQLLIVDSLRGDNQFSTMDYQYLLELLIESQYDHLPHCRVWNLQGKKYTLDEIVWSTTISNPPASISKKELSCEYSTSKKMKQYVESRTKISNLSSEIIDYLYELLKKVVDGIALPISQQNSLVDMLRLITNEAISVPSGNLSFLKKFVWYDATLSKIPYFANKMMHERLFGNRDLIQLGSEVLKPYCASRFSQSTLESFLSSHYSNSSVFCTVCGYISQRFESISFSIGVIPTKGKTLGVSRVWMDHNMDLSKKFPDLDQRCIKKLYKDQQQVHKACKVMGVKEHIPISVLVEKIESLEKENDLKLGNSLCLVLYQEINRQLESGILGKKDITFMLSHKIFRDIYGIHHRHDYSVCLNDDENLFEYFEEDMTFLCIPYVSCATISTFCETMNIKGISSRVQFSKPEKSVFGGDQSNNNNIASDIRLVMKYLNYYCEYKGYEQLDIDSITISGVTALSVIAEINLGTFTTIQKVVATPVYATHNQIVVNVNETLDVIMNHNFFISSLLQFYPLKYHEHLSLLIDVLVGKTEQEMLAYFMKKKYKMNVTIE